MVTNHPLQAILGYPLLRERSQLCLTQLPLTEEWTKSGLELPNEHQQVLKRLCPTVPCREIDDQFEMGNPVQPLPFQEPQRRLNDLKTKYLLEWLPKEVTSGLIEKGKLGDFLSPLVLVQHYDKNKCPIPGEMLGRRPSQASLSKNSDCDAFNR